VIVSVAKTHLGGAYYVISQKYLISGSRRQYHSYFASNSCL
jgi:hypothetical protein